MAWCAPQAVHHAYHGHALIHTVNCLLRPPGNSSDRSWVALEQDGESPGVKARPFTVPVMECSCPTW